VSDAGGWRIFTLQVEIRCKPRIQQTMTSTGITIRLTQVYSVTSAHFSITSNFTYLLANYHQVAPYEQTGNYLDAHPTNYIVDGKPGTGVGSPTFTTFPTGNSNRFAIQIRVLERPTTTLGTGNE
jgi:hypothetical protein